MGYRTLHYTDKTIRFHWGIEIFMSTVQRFTDAPFDVSYGGNTFTRDYYLNITSLGQSNNSISNTSVEISNGDAGIGVLAQAISGKYRNPDVTVYEWWFDASDLTSTTIQETITLVDGRLEAPSWDRSTIKFSIMPFNSSLAGKAPWRAYRHSCPLTVDYRGEQCGAGYNASYPTCGGSFADCTLRANTARFGGMRHVPKDGAKFRVGSEGGSFVTGSPITVNPSSGVPVSVCGVGELS